MGESFIFKVASNMKTLAGPYPMHCYTKLMNTQKHKLVAIPEEFPEGISSLAVVRISFSKHIIFMDPTLPEALSPQIQEAARFIGTMRSDLGIGTAFLCEGGKVVAPLHIHQLLKEGNVPGSMAKQMYVDFIGPDSALYSFKVRGIFNHGISLLARSFSMPNGFDFAILELESDAREIIGGGLSLDPPTHFGSAFVSDPHVTLALSRPHTFSSADGLHVVQYVDVSSNHAASGGHYQFSQSGYHQTSGGDSGKVVLTYRGDTFQVYAMNLGVSRSTGYQTGLKAETLALYWRDPIFPDTYLAPRMGFQYDLFMDLHGFRITTKLNEAAETLAFLQAFGKAFPGHEGIALPSFSGKVPSVVTYSRHQLTHLGTDRSKTRFTHFLNDADPYFQTLALIVQKAVSHVLQKSHHPELWAAIRRSEGKMGIRPTKDLAFYMDLGFEVGYCRKDRKATTWVFVEDPVGGTYHIYPNGIPESGSSKPKENDVWIDLQALLTILTSKA